MAASGDLGDSPESSGIIEKLPFKPLRGERQLLTEPADAALRIRPSGRRRPLSSLRLLYCHQLDLLVGEIRRLVDI